MNREIYDLVVIGSGPGGEVGAIRAAQLGLKTALVEKNEHLGGTCLNVGCIPTKSLVEAAKNWSKLDWLEQVGFSFGNKSFDWQKIQEEKQRVVDAQRKGLKFLMKKNKIDLVTGKGRIHAPNEVIVENSSGEKTTLHTKHILLATGSTVKNLPFAEPNGKTIHSSDTILSIERIPKSMAIIGGGVVGMEFASIFSQFGTQVTVIELLPQILPTEDPECVQELARYLKKAKVEIKTQTKLKGIVDKKDHATVSVEGAADQDFEVVLVSIGRSPATKNIGLEEFGIKLENGFINVDAHYRTSRPNIFAIGDIIKTPALAHTASAEALHAVEIIAGHHPRLIDYTANPSAIYTYPEIASIGFTETALKEKGVEYDSCKFPFAPLAKAKIEHATEGFIKLLYGKKYKEILGVHIVGAKATELISEFILGKILETTVDEIGQAIHPHPTLSETVMEAAHAAIGGAIHL